MTIAEAIKAAWEHQRAGRLREAEAIFRQVIQQWPENGHAWNYLGLVAESTGNRAEAIRLMRKSIELVPNEPTFQANLAGVLRKGGDFAGAEALLRKVIETTPDSPYFWTDLGGVLHSMGRHEEAIAALRTAISLNSLYATAHSYLGNAQAALDRHNEAAASFKRAVDLEPKVPGHASNLGNIYRAMLDFPAAIEWYRRALDADPNNPMVHYNMAVARLMGGDWGGGFQEFEWRLQLPSLQPVARNYGVPRWNGESLEGKTILLYSEFATSDAILFARYVPLVAERGARVILEAPPELFELFKSVKGYEQIVRRGEALPPFDVHTSLLSLALRFDTRKETVPAQFPYLWPDTARIETFSHHFAREEGDRRLRVGLNWSSGAGESIDRRRFLSLHDFAPLAEVSGVRFFSIQSGPQAREVLSPPPGMELGNLSTQIRDFADTAAAISQLDLVISADTAAAHVAGAMGKPVWTLVPHHSDWRWMVEREDTPWYPGMRLFRQPARNDWTTPIARVRDELAKRVGQGR